MYLSCSRYFVAPDKERQFGIFKSEDAGESWRWVFRADSNGMLGTDYDGGWIMEALGPTWGEYPLSMGVSPGDPALCYASDFGCTYRTTDGGATWRQVYTNRTPEGGWVSRGLDVTVCYGVQFDPFDSDHLFANYTDIGALQSFDEGRSWSHAAAGVPRRWANGCYWTVFDPEVQGRAWSVWSSAHDLPRQKMFRGGNFGHNVGGVALSEDGCRTWSLSNEGLPDNTPCTFLALDLASPKDSRTLYACAIGQGVYKSVDGGKSWKMTGEIPGRNKNAWQLKLLADGALVLLVARGLENRQTLDGAVYTSRDGGDSWQPVALPEGVNAPNDLALDPANPQKMWLSLWPSTVEGRETGGGLLVTRDGGVTWNRAFREDAHVFAAAVDPQNPDIIYLNTFDSAAFRSADGGKSWSPICGYGFKWGHRPIVDPYHPGMLYLTTFGGGLFYGPGAGDPEARADISGFQESWRWGNDPTISY